MSQEEPLRFIAKDEFPLPFERGGADLRRPVSTIGEAAIVAANNGSDNIDESANANDAGTPLSVAIDPDQILMNGLLTTFRETAISSTGSPTAEPDANHVKAIVRELNESGIPITVKGLYRALKNQ